MKKLSVQWLKGVTNPKEQEKLEAAIRHSTTALGRLKELLEEQLRELEKDGSKQDYETASWAFLQAHRNGEKAKTRELIALLSFLD